MTNILIKYIQIDNIDYEVEIILNVKMLKE